MAEPMLHRRGASTRPPLVTSAERRAAHLSGGPTVALGPSLRPLLVWRCGAGELTCVAWLLGWDGGK